MCIGPCLVSRVPARAAPSMACTVNMSAMLIRVPLHSAGNGGAEAQRAAPVHARRGLAPTVEGKARVCCEQARPGHAAAPSARGRGEAGAPRAEAARTRPPCPCPFSPAAPDDGARRACNRAPRRDDAARIWARSCACQCATPAVSHGGTGPADPGRAPPPPRCRASAGGTLGAVGRGADTRRRHRPRQAAYSFPSFCRRACLHYTPCLTAGQGPVAPRSPPASASAAAHPAPRAPLARAEQ